MSTATAVVTVAVSRGREVLAALQVVGGRRHAETLAPAIRSATSLAGVEIADAGLVGLDSGPGLFTGLRVGTATAKALASALGVQVATCSSLELLAHPHRRAGRSVAAVVDARRGQVFWQVFEPDGDGLTATGPAEAADPGEVAGLLEGRGLLLTGDGARRYLSGPAFDLAPEEYDLPGAAALAALTASAVRVAPEKVTPTYLREADVRIGWDRR